MRRLVAFLFDSTWIALVVGAVWYVIRYATGRDVPIDAVMLVGMTCTYVVLEYLYFGQTPGRFLTGIRVRSVAIAHPKLSQLVVRSTVLFATAPALVVVLNLLHYGFNNTEIGSLAYYSWMIVALMVAIPMLCTGGQQGFHDWASDTLVQSRADRVGRRASVQVMVGAIVVVLIIALLYMAIVKTLFDKSMGYEGNGIFGKEFKQEFMEQSYKWAPSHLLVNQGVRSPEEYYISHGWVGFRDAGDMEFDGSTPVWLDRTKLVAYRIRVTWKGWIDRRYQQRVLENLAMLAHDRGSGGPVVVEFVWLSNVLDRLVIDVRHSEVGIIAHMGDKDHSRVLISTVPIDGIAVGSGIVIGLGTLPSWIGDPERGPGIY